MSDVVRGEGWKMHHGDCIGVMKGIDRTDHVITDPPYSEHVHTRSRAGARPAPLRDGNGELSRSALSRTVDFGFAHLSPDLMHACAQTLGALASRWVLVFSDRESDHLWRGELVASGLEYIRTLDWIKEGCTPQFTGDRPAVASESITLCHPKGRKRWNGGGKRGVYSIPIELDRYGHGRVSRVHPTQKPIDLMLALVTDFTDPGETILDPFAGSATTGVACLRLGRRFIGIERDPKYFALACERLKAEESGSTLAAARAGQLPLLGGSR